MHVHGSDCVMYIQQVTLISVAVDGLKMVKIL